VRDRLFNQDEDMIPGAGVRMVTVPWIDPAEDSSEGG
jgi:hypothetical protein